jgi:hypothetical protein
MIEEKPRASSMKPSSLHQTPKNINPALAGFFVISSAKESMMHFLSVGSIDSSNL